MTNSNSYLNVQGAKRAKLIYDRGNDLFDHGYSHFLELLKEANVAFCKPPLTIDEINTIYHHILFKKRQKTKIEGVN